jgi:hypothetical protein
MPEARPYQRVLALIDFDNTDGRIARKALLLARLNRAQLAFLHLAEPDAALDGGYPAPGSRTDAAALEAASLRRLNFMAAQLGAGEAECLAQCGPAHQTFKQKLKEWQPDLVVSAKDFPFLSGPHDVLILSQDKRSNGRGMLRRLTSWLGSQFQPAAL